MIKIGVCGANGRMGKTVVNAVCAQDDMELVAKIDVCGDGVYKNINDAIKEKKIDVLIDFTQPKVIFENAKFCLNNKINSVIGTTGLSDEQISELKTLSEKNKTACFIAPNFSTGAVLMMMFAAKAAKYFDNAEIIELHHNQKKDAPSGTAVKTAKMMAEAKKSFTLGNCAETELIEGARGGKSYSDIHIHSVRMPGYMASQQVIFGSDGQTFKIIHDSTNRECYMPGVMMAVRHAYNKKDFVYGLDNIL